MKRCFKCLKDEVETKKNQPLKKGVTSKVANYSNDLEIGEFNEIMPKTKSPKMISANILFSIFIKY